MPRSPLLRYDQTLFRDPEVFRVHVRPGAPPPPRMPGSGTSPAFCGRSASTPSPSSGAGRDTDPGPRITMKDSKCKIEKRPGRDLNPGQKLRRLLGYPLPYRDTRISAFPLTTRLFWLKRIAHRRIRTPRRGPQGPGLARNKTRSPVNSYGTRGPICPPPASARAPSPRFRRARSGSRPFGPRRPFCGCPYRGVSRNRPRPRSRRTPGP